MDKKLEARGKKFIRCAAGEKWDDPTLGEWDAADYRIFAGDLGNEVTDDVLSRAFNKYPSFLKAKGDCKSILQLLQLLSLIFVFKLFAKKVQKWANQKDTDSFRSEIQKILSKQCAR